MVGAVAGQQMQMGDQTAILPTVHKSDVQSL
jgi:hypothetical protein